jgi:hypothetical protein
VRFHEMRHEILPSLPHRTRLNETGQAIRGARGLMILAALFAKNQTLFAGGTLVIQFGFKGQFLECQSPRQWALRTTLGAINLGILWIEFLT